LAAWNGRPYPRRTSSPRRPLPSLPPPPDFEEAERALALISGKDPEIVRKARVLRERDAEAEDVRARALAAERDAATRRRHLGMLRAGAIGVTALAALAAGAWVFVQRGAERERREAALATLAPAAAPFVSQGFSPVLTGAGTVTTHTDGCIVAVAATPKGPAALTLQVGASAPISATGNAAMCVCDEDAVVATSAEPGAIVGVYHAAGTAIGGARGLRALDPPPSTMAEGGAGCQRDHLARWLEGRAPSIARARATTAQGPMVDALRARGLGVVGFARGAVDVVPIATSRATCYVATSSRAGETLTLSGRDGTTLLEGPALAWCDGDAALRMISRGSGGGDVVVASGESSVVGSLAGLAARARAAGVAAPVTFLDPTVLDAASVDALRASRAIEPKAEPEGTLAADPTLQLVAVSRSRDADPFDRGALICPEAPAAQTLCFLPPQRPYRAPTRMGLAHAAAPFWLPAIDDPRALAAVLPVLAVVRELSADGFEPTTLEGVTETYAAVDVSGRAGEDGVIAIALSPSAPWVLPLSDQATSWKLGEPPHVIPLKPGAKTTLRSPLLVAMPPTTRRTLVLRRHER
jgi:hypothetical protein